MPEENDAWLEDILSQPIPLDEAGKPIRGSDRLPRTFQTGAHTILAPYPEQERQFADEPSEELHDNIMDFLCDCFPAMLRDHLFETYSDISDEKIAVLTTQERLVLLRDIPMQKLAYEEYLVALPTPVVVQCQPTMHAYLPGDPEERALRSDNDMTLAIQRWSFASNLGDALNAQRHWRKLLRNAGYLLAVGVVLLFVAIGLIIYRA